MMPQPNLMIGKRDSILNHAEDFKKKQGKTGPLSLLRGVSPQRREERALTPSRPCYTTLLVKDDSLKHWCLDQREAGGGAGGRSVQDSSFMFGEAVNSKPHVAATKTCSDFR